MNIDTGEIFELDKVKSKPTIEQSRFREISDTALSQMAGMNRKQRRKYYRENKYLFRGIKEQSNE